MGACFPTALLRHRMCLVVLVNETLKVNHQLGARLPAVVCRRIAAPANKITRSLPLHVTVVQDTLQVKALTTAEVGRLQQRVHDLCDRSEQERQEHLSLEVWVQRIRRYRSDDRSEFAFYQLENERARQVFRAEVAELRRQHAALQSHIEKLSRDQRNLLEVHERDCCIRLRKRPRADGTGGDGRHKT
uniref:RxLR effector candidate protein n=1 Tax=Hyaloperonospora arabidopsidis (strain Emoy2) TaxID=559515 RepID=M4BT17_HYAAE